MSTLYQLLPTFVQQYFGLAHKQINQKDTLQGVSEYQHVMGTNNSAELPPVSTFVAHDKSCHRFISTPRLNL